MKPGYASKSNLGVGLGILSGILFLYLLITQTPLAVSNAGKALLAVGQMLFVWGCCMYASGKGYHPAWGVLGLGNIPGLAILVLFPDRFPQPKSKGGWLIGLAVVAVLLLTPVVGFFMFMNKAVGSSSHAKRSTESRPVPASSLRTDLDRFASINAQALSTMRSDSANADLKRQAVTMLEMGRPDTQPAINEAVIYLEGKGALSDVDKEVLEKLRPLRN